jgi:hypothetical protein
MTKDKKARSLIKSLEDRVRKLEERNETVKPFGFGMKDQLDHEDEDDRNE